ncbi:large subunit ribosomal protein L18 [Desulfitispora alkaliphila]|uniref:50S ribosomal protein L18 n=1 Tax=Desulfitispora alkaliphila TaxID=622674 RepID=UPI003D213494
MIKRQSRKLNRAKKRMRLRNKLVGTTERPRLNVYKSLNNIYAQVINDENGNTLVAASTLDPELKDKVGNGGNTEAAKMVGELIAKRAQEKGCTKVVFDRAGYIYHGRVAALADAAREAGLEF